MAKKKKKTIRITLKKSPIGKNKRQRDTLQSLGLRRINQSVEHSDNQVLRGMLDKVQHLVQVDEL